MKSIIVTLIFYFFLNLCLAQIIEGYTDKASYRAGEIVRFYLNTQTMPGFCNGNPTPPDCHMDLSIYDVTGGYTGNTINNINFSPQTSNNSESWINGYGYYQTCAWTVPSNLESGLYFLEGLIPFIIKGDNTLGGADIVVVSPTNTDAAYNTKGGKNFYDTYINNILGPAPIISFHRPIVIPTFPYFQGSVDLKNGFLKWLTTKNYKVNVIADQDLDDPTEIANAKLLIIIGHSEYWTRQARKNLDNFVDIDGNDALILSGNSMGWLVRFQTDPNNADNPQLVCFKHWATDPTTNQLQNTIEWIDPNLKYSCLSSIGADWNNGGYGLAGTAQHDDIDIYNVHTPDPICNYGGFNGHKIIMPGSPLFNNAWNHNNINSISTFAQGEVLSFVTGEFDGTLMKKDGSGNVILDGNGDPTLDVSALGFYRAELIGYDKTTKPHEVTDDNIHYCPFLVFQKTSTSGRVINVSSNTWCSDVGMGGETFSSVIPYYCSTTVAPDTRINLITQNMIDLLLAHDEANHPIFANSAPTSFDIKPSKNNVSYSACQDGSIRITPGGFYVTNGYKVDHGYYKTHGGGQGNDNNDGTFDAAIDVTCATYHPLRVSGNGGNLKPKSSNKTNTNVSLFPNPNTGTFTININDVVNGNFSLIVTDIYGRVIEQRNNLVNGNNQVDNNDLSAGLYLWQVYSGNSIIGKGKVSIVKQN